jgi:hypothetical protein
LPPVGSIALHLLAHGWFAPCCAVDFATILVYSFVNGLLGLGWVDLGLACLGWVDLLDLGLA